MKEEVTNNENSGEAQELSRAERPAPRPLPQRTPADELADLKEQLLTEREELQRQAQEFYEFREQAEGAVRAARTMEGLARLTEENPDPALRVALNGTIRYRNPASFSLCRQWNTDDGRKVPPKVRELAAAAYASMKTIRREVVFGDRTYLLTVEPTPANYVNVFARDITARKQAEEALRESNAKLEHRTKQLQKLTLELAQTEDRERKRMAEILHDDLQQVLAGAKFHLSILRSRAQHEPALQEMAGQIDQMLKDAIEKSRSLSHELSPAVLHQGDLTETLGWLAGQVEAKHGLVVRVHADGKVNLPSDTTAAFIYRIAQELLFNVVKHARVKEARLRIRRHGPWICLSVSDRGHGFDPQELRGAPGYGLLSIRERVELLGGRLKIRSARGKGSTFSIAVSAGGIMGAGSAAETRPQERSKEGGRSGGQYNGRLRVLLADDHRIVREGLRLLLGGERDVEVVGEAVHGREAVDLALRLEPDVIIMDVSMPLIDGDVATRQIKAHLPRTRVIALSTYSEPETRAKMYQAGAESYVLKTASSEELLAAIRGKERSP